MTHDDAVTTLATERYLLDEMSELDRHEFEEHYFTCAICADDLRAGAALAEAARASGAATSMPAGPPATVVPFRRRWTASAVAPLAAAAALAVVAGYQSLVTIPALRDALAPRAVAPVVLAPASRGEETVVGAGAEPLVLSLDVNVPQASRELVYDLRTDSGTVVVTGRTPTPLPGTPLVLMLPRGIAAGAYVVAVRAADDPGAGNTYRFRVR